MYAHPYAYKFRAVKETEAYSHFISFQFLCDSNIFLVLIFIAIFICAFCTVLLGKIGMLMDVFLFALSYIYEEKCGTNSRRVYTNKINWKCDRERAKESKREMVLFWTKKKIAEEKKLLKSVSMPWKLSEKNVRIRGGSIGRTRLEPSLVGIVLLTNKHDIMASLAWLIVVSLWLFFSLGHDQRTHTQSVLSSSNWNDQNDWISGSSERARFLTSVYVLSASVCILYTDRQPNISCAQSALCFSTNL